MKKSIAALSILIACQSWAQQWHIEESWKSAVVHVPGKWFSSKLENVEVENPMPVVIYLHGCSGISQTDQSWARTLKGMGFVVVMPDSLAIPGRQSNCDTVNKKTNLGKVNATELRSREVEYALKQIRLKPWADQRRIFIMGHSEGAVGVTRVNDELIKGIVISGFPCVHGLWADKNIPVLAIGGSEDPWFGNRYNHRQCIDHWGDRSDATQIVLEGRGHGTAEESRAIEGVKSFFKRLISEK